MKARIKMYALPVLIWGALIVLVCAHSCARADYLYTGAVSEHLIAGEFNESHDLLAYRHERFTLGYFKNSYYEPTGVFTYAYKLGDYQDFELNINAGVTYGYRKCYGYEQGPKVVCPYIGPELVYTKYKLQPVITYLGQAVVFSLRWEL
jgi:hypothetical protein